MCSQESRAATSSSVKVHLDFSNRAVMVDRIGPEIPPTGPCPMAVEDGSDPPKCTQVLVDLTSWISKKGRNDWVKSMIDRLIYVELKILKPTVV